MKTNNFIFLILFAYLVSCKKETPSKPPLTQIIISGQVIDGKTGKPIDSAFIETDRMVGFGTVYIDQFYTDKNGKYNQIISCNAQSLDVGKKGYYDFYLANFNPQLGDQVFNIKLIKDTTTVFQR